MMAVDKMCFERFDWPSRLKVSTWSFDGAVDGF